MPHHPLPRIAQKNSLKHWPRAAALLGGCALAWAAQAVEVSFQPVAPNVYAHVGDTEGRTYENEALNANIGLVVTPAGALPTSSPESRPALSGVLTKWPTSSRFGSSRMARRANFPTLPVPQCTTR